MTNNNVAVSFGSVWCNKGTQMFDETLLNIIRQADSADPEDLFLRVAIAVTLRGTEDLIFGRQPDQEDRCAA